MLSTAGIAGGALLLIPGTGSLKVYATGPDGQVLDSVDIYVNNEKICTASPCLVEGLSPGIHDVYAESIGYAPVATRGVEITAGNDSLFEIELLEPSTGIEVAAAHPGITLHINGEPIGPLPQKLTDLRPGEHTLRFVGTDRHEPIVRTVAVIPNKLENLGTIALPVKLGRATFETTIEGVRMRLVRTEGEPRMLEENEAGRVSMDLDPSKHWKFQACKPGHDLFETPVTFDDGEAEKTFHINFTGDGMNLPSWCGLMENTRTAVVSTAAPSAGTAGGDGKVSFNSIPPSAAVVLNGRPIGRTPMAGVSVPPGTHSVVFIHPEKGRKTSSVTVKTGQRTGVGVRF